MGGFRPTLNLKNGRITKSAPQARNFWNFYTQKHRFYEDYFAEGYDPNLAVFLSIPALEIVQFKAYYERRGLKGFSDAFVIDEKSYAVAEGRYELFPHLYLVAQAEQRWADADKDGTYEAADPEYSVGLEAAFSL